MSEKKRRKIAEDGVFFRLLDLCKEIFIDKSIERVDGDAIIEEVRRNPQLAAMKYDFESRYNRKRYCYPLQQAILLRSSIDVVEAIYNSYPQAIQETLQGPTALHLSISCKAPVEVVLFLISEWPEGVKQKYEPNGFTPLHFACMKNAPHEVFSSLLNIWPDAAKEKDMLYDQTPLHMAFTLERTPPLKTISLILDNHPGAVKEKDTDGRIPLHYVARQADAPLDVISILLQKWPNAILQGDNEGKKPLDMYEGGRGEVHQLLSSVYQLYSRKHLNADKLKEMMEFFISIGWTYGIFLLLDQQPALMKDLDIDFNLFPDLFFAIGQHCKMRTMWKVVRNKLDIMEGV